MQPMGPLIQKIAIVGVGGRASLAEILAIMGGTTAAVLVIVWLSNRRKARAAKSQSRA